MKGRKKIPLKLSLQDPRGLAKFISALEKRDLDSLAALADLYRVDSNTKILGITGPPGAGKSTLIGSLIRFLREQKKTVAIVAVDPVSPFSGGAVLGDRIRLQEHFNDSGVFIRSLSTRGKLGGLSASTRATVDALCAAGFDWVLVETVGVGQSEVDVRTVADLTAVVLTPEWGDAVQALKAGILEIGDLFIIHKADREGAERVESDLKALLAISGRAEIPVFLSSSQNPESLRALGLAVAGQFECFEPLKRRRAHLAGAIQDLIADALAGGVRGWLKENASVPANPYGVLVRFLKKYPGGSLLTGPKPR